MAVLTNQGSMPIEVHPMKSPLPTTAHEKSVRPDINKPFENPDLKEFLKKFEGESLGAETSNGSTGSESLKRGQKVMSLIF
jgi:hypothetical protein